MIKHRAIVVAMAAGVVSLSLPSTAAFADQTSPSSTPPTPVSPTSSSALPTLTVTLTPDKVAPGGAVKIEASLSQGSLKAATATSPALGTVTLTTTATGASGTGHVGTDIKAGVYTVTVSGTQGTSTLRGSTDLTVVVTTVSPSPSPSPSSTVPKGGVKTGGGGTSRGADVALISAGAAIALIGAGFAVAAIRRRRADAHN